MCEPSSIAYRFAGSEDEADLRALLRENAMDSWVRISMEREPDYFAGGNLLGRSASVVARTACAKRAAVGMYSCDFIPSYLGGRETTIAYLGGLRVAPAYRHRLSILREGYRSIAQILPEIREVPIVFTSIARGNRAARRILEANLPRMPRYRFLAEMETYVASVERGKNHGLLSAATPEDREELIAFHRANASTHDLAPSLSGGNFDRIKGLKIGDFLLHRARPGGAILACLALWDQRSFKQVVVQGYKKPLGYLRKTYNLWARLCRSPLLPAPSQPLEQIFIAFMAFAPSVASDIPLMIQEALWEIKRRGAPLGTFGLASLSPHRTPLRRALAPKVYASRIYAVLLDKGLCDPHCQNIQPEVALL